jgi:RNA polymerase sigma-70 factor, ECF subfamily
MPVGAREDAAVAVPESESASFEDFVRAEQGRLFSAMFLATGDRAEAEDLAQEALARVYERWGRVRGMGSPAGYLFATAFNLHRKRLRRPRHRLPAARDEPPDPAEVAVTRDAVLRVLAALPPTQREAVILVEWLGMTSEDAGRTLGVDADSVRGRVHRARASLRKRFGSEP